MLQAASPRVPASPAQGASETSDGAAGTTSGTTPIYFSALKNSSRSTPEAPTIWLSVPLARSRACMGTTTR